EGIDATGEGNAAADGIVVLNCTALVKSCVVRDITSGGVGSPGTCISAVTATNTFIDNNYLSHAFYGLSVSGGGARVYYRNNLAAGCATNFNITGGVDRGGNF